jgi:hypothetical protein
MAIARSGFPRDYGMHCLPSVISQQQGAGKGLVFRVFDDDLGFCDYPGDCLWIDPALEHALEGVAGEIQGFAVHAFVFLAV